MSFVDAFLVVTCMAYFIATGFPKKFQQNVPFIVEKVAFILLGIFILASITLDNVWLWSVLGTIYVILALLSYKGYQNWSSTAQNLFMACWDLLIAIISISKVI